MTVRAIAARLFQIVIPTPFPVGPVNVYLSAGSDEPLTLIDTGPGTEQARVALEHSLAALGYMLVEVERIVITHAHTDHYGLAGDIVQVSGASVFSHPRNHPVLEDHAGERLRRGAFYDGMLSEAGVPQDIRTYVGRTLSGFRHLATALPAVRALDEGDRLRLGDKSWRVLFMPGHAGGLICLYQPQTRLFLSNDHLLRDVSSNPLLEPPPPGHAGRRRSLIDYLASLERTAALDIAVSWPGHGEPIFDHRALIDNRLDFHHRRADKILTALADGARTAFEISRAIFPKLDAADSFLAISEVLAHLEWLEEQGKAASQPQNGLSLWRAT